LEGIKMTELEYKLTKRVQDLEELISEASSYVEEVESKLRKERVESRRFKDMMWEEYEQKERLQKIAKELTEENKKLKDNLIVSNTLMEELIKQLPTSTKKQIQSTNRVIDNAIAENYLKAKIKDNRELGEIKKEQNEDGTQQNSSLRDLIKQTLKTTIDVKI
jgi:hypothetical protein